MTDDQDDRPFPRNWFIAWIVLLVAVGVSVLLMSCAGAKIKPFVSYTSFLDGSNIGINPEENRFINVPQGDSWTGGIMLELPIGAPQDQRVLFEWPRYPLPTLATSAGWQPPPVDTGPAPSEPEDIEDRVVETLEESDWPMILRFAAILAIIAFFAWIGVGIWRRFKNGKPSKIGPVH